MFTPKKLHTVILLVIGLAATAFRSDRAVPLSADELATVYIYRTGQFFSATVNYAIFADGKKICELSNNKYIKQQVNPGHVVYMANETGVNLFKKETGFELDIQAGKTYYIQCTPKTSVLRKRLEMSEVTENTAKRDMAKLTVDNCQLAATAN